MGVQEVARKSSDGSDRDRRSPQQGAIEKCSDEVTAERRRLDSRDGVVRERRDDGALVSRTKGVVTSVEKGNTSLDFSYKKDENGEIKRDGQHRPIIEKVTLTVNGKSRELDLQELARIGDYEGERQYRLNNFGDDKFKSRTLDLSTLSVEQAGSAAGKLTIMRDDGAKCIYGFGEGTDGKLVARPEQVECLDGSSRKLQYNDKQDPLLCTSFVDRRETASGWVTDTNTRVGKDMEHRTVDSSGKVTESYTMHDVHITGDAQAYYRLAPNPQMEEQFQHALEREGLKRRSLEEIFGPSWLKANDLSTAKQHLLDVAGNHLFGSRQALEKHVNGMIARMRGQEKIGMCKISDDQIASVLRSIAKMPERINSRHGAAASLASSEVYKRTEEVIRQAESPYKESDQGQVGACGLFATQTMVWLYKPDRMAAAVAGAYTDGTFRGQKYNTFDLRPYAGENGVQHLEATVLAKACGIPHVTQRALGWGTNVNQLSKAYAAITGGHLRSYSRSASRDIKAMGAVLKMEPNHWTIVTRNPVNGKLREENSWGRYGGRYERDLG